MIYLDPTQFGQQQEDELIPEGTNLFTIYNMWFGKYDPNPRNKKRADDFVWYFHVQFQHIDTGLLINRLDNGLDGYWATVLKLEKVGNLDTRELFYNFMTKIGAPKNTVDPENPNAVIFWAIVNGKPTFTGHDEEPPGPLGLPVKLNIIHKDVQAMTVKRDANGNVVTEIINGRKRNVFVPKLNDDGTPVMVKREFIETIPAPDYMQGRFGEADYRWPKLYDLANEEKDVRGIHARQKSELDQQIEQEAREFAPDNEIDW